MVGDGRSGGFRRGLRLSTVWVQLARRMDGFTGVAKSIMWSGGLGVTTSTRFFYVVLGLAGGNARGYRGGQILRAIG